MGNLAREIPVECDNDSVVCDAANYHVIVSCVLSFTAPSNKVKPFFVIALKTFYVPKRFVASKFIGVKPCWLTPSFETLGIPHSLFVKRGKIESTSEVKI